MSQNTILSNAAYRTKTGITTQKKMKQEIKPSVKRPASSPAKGSTHKRSAFGDITNAVAQKLSKDGNKKTEKSTRRKSKRIETIKSNSKCEKLAMPFSDTESLGSSQPSSGNSSFCSAISDEVKSMKIDTTPEESTPDCFYQHSASPSRKHLDFIDLDAANSENIHEAPEYAFVIFEYMRSRERMFVIEEEYLSNQKELTPDMRAIVVDWMVEIQESFELNHETLYLAVKLVDHYLQKVKVSRDKLQLVGATSLLIAAKFDERHPPFVDDFLYICDDTYTRNEILEMERSILTQVGFDINIPVAYRYLRRYAKCAKSNMKTLTLARFVLELSLQNYSVVHESASKLAAAALWLAFKMDAPSNQWNDTLHYYSSHTEQDIIELASELNRMISATKGKNLKTVWTKYSHSIFYEVAKTAPLSDETMSAEKSRVFATQDDLLHL